MCLARPPWVKNDVPRLDRRLNDMVFQWPKICWALPTRTWKSRGSRLIHQAIVSRLKLCRSRLKWSFSVNKQFKCKLSHASKGGTNQGTVSPLFNIFFFVSYDKADRTLSLSLIFRIHVVCSIMNLICLKMMLFRNPMSLQKKNYSYHPSSLCTCIFLSFACRPELVLSSTANMGTFFHPLAHMRTPSYLCISDSITSIWNGHVAAAVCRYCVEKGHWLFVMDHVLYGSKPMFPII